LGTALIQIFSRLGYGSRNDDLHVLGIRPRLEPVRLCCCNRSEFRRVLGLLRQLRLKWQAFEYLVLLCDTALRTIPREKHTSYYYGAGYVMMDPSALSRRGLSFRACKGAELSRRYSISFGYGESGYQATSAGAVLNDPGNLITTNVIYASGPNQYALQRMVNADGTLSTFAICQRIRELPHHVTASGRRIPHLLTCRWCFQPDCPHSAGYTLLDIS